MNSRRVEWVEVSILAALGIFTVLTLLGTPDLELPFNVTVYLGVSYLVLLLQPSQIFAGRAKLSDDIWTTIGIVLLGAPLAFQSLNELATIVSSIGFLVLFVAALVLMRNVHKASLLGTLKQQRMRAPIRFIVTWLFVLLLFVAVFQPLTRFIVWVSGYTWAMFAIILIFLIALLEEHDVFHIQWLETLWKRIRLFGGEVRKLFFHQKTFLLGIAGLLVAQFLMNVIMNITDASLAAYSSVSGSWGIAAGVLSYLGILLLIFLPPYVWFKTVLVRKSHIHVPDWSMFAVCSCISLIVIALLYPLLAFVPIIGEHMYGAVLDAGIPSASSKMALIMGGLVFIIAFVIASLDDFLRKALMTGPFLAAIVFLGMYVFKSFESLFLHTVHIYLGSLSSWTFSLFPISIVLFFATSVFLIAGFLSFLYEIWRE